MLTSTGLIAAPASSDEAGLEISDRFAAYHSMQQDVRAKVKLIARMAGILLGSIRDR
jgi:hypothetical protein